MGRKKKTAPPAGTTLHIVGNSGASTDDDDQDEIDEIDRLEDGELSRAMEEVAKVTGAVVEVVKLEDDRQKWCRNYPVARFSNEQIAGDFGAGTYRIRFKGPNKAYLKGGWDAAPPPSRPRAASATCSPSSRRNGKNSRRNGWNGRSCWRPWLCLS